MPHELTGCILNISADRRRDCLVLKERAYKGYIDIYIYI